MGLENLGKARPGIANDIGGGDIAEEGRAFVEIVALGQAAHDPVDAAVPIWERCACATCWRESGQRRGGGGGVGGLGIVDEGHAMGLCHPLHAVRQAPEGGEAGPPLRFGEAQSLDNGDGDGGVLQIMRPLQRGPIGLGGGQPRAIDHLHMAARATRRLVHGDMRGFGVAFAKHRVLIRALQLEQPRLGIGIGVEIAIAVEMVGGDIEQRRDIAGEAEGEIDLVARQLQNIDATPMLIGQQRRLPEDRQADIAAHPCGNPCPGQQMMHQHGGGGFAIGAGDPHHAMRRQGGAGLGEKLDIADQRHASRAGGIADRVAVYRDAGRNQHARETGEIKAARIG